MFKELRLFDKARKGSKSTGLSIDIQEYSNLIEMDLKGYLIELIYNMCKFKKDFAMEIRIIIKKFRLPFRQIYT